MSEYVNQYDEKLKQCLNNILEKIVSLPEENRWEFFVNEREYDRVAELLMKAQNETFFNQLKRGTTDGISESGKMAKKKFSSEAWMQALKYTIEKYQEDEISFIAKFKTNYETFYSKEYNAMKLKEMTGGMVVRQRHSVKEQESDINIDARLYRFVKDYIKLKSQFNEKQDWDKLEEQFCTNYKCSKGDFELIKKLTEIVLVSQYSQGESEEEGYDILEQQSYDKADTTLAYSPEEMVVLKDEQEETSSQIQKEIERIKFLFAGSKVKEREFYRAFFTKDVLRSLKLEQGIGDDGKTELKCGNTHRYKELPAGDEQIYNVLKLNEYDLMNELFHMEYIQYAIEEEPQSLNELYGIYYNFLESNFQFTNKCVAQVIGTTTQKVSRYYNGKYVLLLEEMSKHGY